MTKSSPKTQTEIWRPGQVVERPIETLQINRNNPRTHSPAQLRKLRRSIETFGFTNPVLIDRDDQIVAGHGRVTAALSIGLTTVPTVRLDHLTPAQAKAYAMAENRIGDLAGWDKDLLRLELGALLEFDTNFDLSLTGFEDAEIDLVLHDPAEGKNASPESEAAPGILAISKQGDVWRLGDHLIMCGDARDRESYRQMLADDRAAMVFTDPPYNVPIAGHVTSQAQHREFAMGVGEMTAEAFIQFLQQVLSEAVTASLPGAIHMVCMDWRHITDLAAAAGPIYDDQINLCVWDKGSGGMGSLYRSQHELIGIYRTKGKRHRNNVQLGRFGRNRTNIWRYPGATTLGSEVRQTADAHPTVKPVQMVADAILDVTKSGDIVLDPFGGSGSTLLAAERTSRRARLVEIDPLYVDLTVRRWQSETGGTARLVGTDDAFDSVNADRRKENHDD